MALCKRFGFKMRLGYNQYMMQRFRFSDIRIERNGTAGISHVGLSVLSLDETYNFFNKLGWEQIGGDENYPAKYISDGVSLLTLWQIPSRTPTSFDREENAGLHHIALKVDSKKKLYDLFERVQQIDGTEIEFEPQEVKGVGWWNFVCYEPGGIRVEFTWRGTPIN